MSRRAQATVPLIALVLVLGSLPMWWRFFAPRSPTMSMAMSAASQSPPGGQSVAPDLAVKLIRAGLDARALAAAGVSANATSTLIASANTHLLAHPSDLSSADTAYATAKRESDRLQRLIQSGHGSAEDASSYQEQSAMLANATASQLAAIAAEFQAATSGLTNAQRSALQRMQANRTWELPLEYLVVEHTQVEWVALRGALANERISAKYGDTADPDGQALLASARADSAVALAKTSLDTNAASVTAAWNSASASAN